MSQNYEVFVEDLERDLPCDTELVLTLKDLTSGPKKYDNRIFKAVVTDDPEGSLEWSRLEVRSWTGVLYEESRWVRLLEEMGELMPGRPHGESLPAITN